MVEYIELPLKLFKRIIKKAMKGELTSRYLARYSSNFKISDYKKGGKVLKKYDRYKRRSRR